MDYYFKLFFIGFVINKSKTFLVPLFDAISKLLRCLSAVNNLGLFQDAKNYDRKGAFYGNRLGIIMSMMCNKGFYIGSSPKLNILELLPKLWTAALLAIHHIPIYEACRTKSHLIPPVPKNFLICSSSSGPCLMVFKVTLWHCWYILYFFIIFTYYYYIYCFFIYEWKKVFLSLLMEKLLLA